MWTCLCRDQKVKLRPWFLPCSEGRVTKEWKKVKNTRRVMKNTFPQKSLLVFYSGTISVSFCSVTTYVSIQRVLYVS